MGRKAREQYGEQDVRLAVRGKTLYQETSRVLLGYEQKEPFILNHSPRLRVMSTMEASWAPLAVGTDPLSLSFDETNIWVANHGSDNRAKETLERVQEQKT